MGRTAKERRKRRDGGPPASGRTNWLLYAGAIAGIAIVALAAFVWMLRPPRVWKDGSPAWSPDGRRIAFYSERDGNADIYVMSADGSGVTPSHQHQGGRGISILVAGRKDDHVRLRSRRQLRDLCDGRGRLQSARG